MTKTEFNGFVAQLREYERRQRQENLRRAEMLRAKRDAVEFTKGLNNVYRLPLTHTQETTDDHRG